MKSRTRKQSRRMRTAHVSDWGVCPTLLPEADSPTPVADPPVDRPSWMQTPLEGTQDQAAKQEVTSYRVPPPPVDRQTPVKILP